MKTARASLRRFAAGDLARMRELESDPGVMRFTPMRVALPAEKSAERLSGLLKREAASAPLGVWAAELGDGDFAGWFMLMKTEFAGPELGFMIVRRHWGKGLATEIGAALVAHAAALGHEQVFAVTDYDNAPSIRVLGKLGFVQVETREKHDPVLGRAVRALVFRRG